MQFGNFIDNVIFYKRCNAFIVSYSGAEILEEVNLYINMLKTYT